MCFVIFCQGCGPTVARAMVVNAAQLASYSQAKQFILGTGNCRICANTVELRYRDKIINFVFGYEIMDIICI